MSKEKKCELCGEPLTEENEAEYSDLERCIDCWEEWHDFYPDRV